MEKSKEYYLMDQAYIFSIISFASSPLFGVGIIYAVPCLTLAINIKKNYIGYNVAKLDKTIFFSLMGMLFSSIALLIYLNIIK